MLKGITSCRAQSWTGNITQEEIREVLDRLTAQLPPFRRLLLAPPDLTRCYSAGGEIAGYLYRALSPRGQVKIMPAVGTHSPMNGEQRRRFFGEDIPEEAYLHHDWRRNITEVGVVPLEVVREATGGRWDRELPVEIDSRLTDGSFDLIISIGQVVPHEIAGMANYTKNILVGLGGPRTINESHMAGAVCDLETIMGNVDTPVRKLFDYAEEHFLNNIPIVYVLTVTTQDHGEAAVHGIFCGSKRESFEEAAKLAERWNVIRLPRKVKKVIAYLEPEEFTSLWVGNKAVYRTRMMIEDGGELLVIAPGLHSFGENEEVDQLIRRYGYRGTEAVMRWMEEGVFGQTAMVPAHLIHGSSEGRFFITYAVNPALMTREEIEGVGYGYMELGEALRRYPVEEMEDGFCTMADGEEIFVVKAPAVGVWKV